MSHTSTPVRTRWTKPYFQLSRYAPPQLQAHMATFASAPVWSRAPSQHLRALFDWVRIRDHQRSDIGARFRDLFYMRLDYSDTANHDWQCVRALGRGGYGAVALFELWDASGIPQDYMVVKTAAIDTSLAVSLQIPQLSTEAAIMAQTNENDRDGLLLLRDFKAGRKEGFRLGSNAVPDPLQWRYYLEYCPHGDLERLRVRYKGYGRYLPELFLWHIFYWLARGIQRYKDGFIDDTGTASWWDITQTNWGEEVYDGYLLHNDIKPQNVFLGDADPDTPMSYYPCIPRLADLGLADITFPGDRETRADRMDKGTLPWKAPEQRWGYLDVNSDFYPVPEDLPPLQVGDNRMRKNQHAIHSSANVFAIGLIMFQMMTLHEIFFISNIIDNTMRERAGFRTADSAGRNHCVIDDRGFRTSCHYSDELKTLIRQCMMLNSQDRATEDQLCADTHQGYERALSALPPAPNESGDTIDYGARIKAHAAVYYRENEIDTAPLNINERVWRFVDRDTAWWENIFMDQYMWMPQEWGPLQPRDMPTTIQMPSGWPRAFQRYLAQALASASTPGSTRSVGRQTAPQDPGQPPAQFPNMVARPQPSPLGQLPTVFARPDPHLGRGRGNGRGRGRGRDQGGGFGAIGQGRPQMAIPVLDTHDAESGEVQYDDSVDRHAENGELDSQLVPPPEQEEGDDAEEEQQQQTEHVTSRSSNRVLARAHVKKSRRRRRRQRSSGSRSKRRAYAKAAAMSRGSNKENRNEILGFTS